MVIKYLKFLGVLTIISLNSRCSITESKVQVCENVKPEMAVKKLSLGDVRKIEKYNDNYILVEGFFKYSFEDVAIYRTEDSDPDEAMWVDLKFLDSATIENIQELANQRVVIVGKVDFSRKGHFGMYNGTLKNVLCMRKIM